MATFDDDGVGVDVEHYKPGSITRIKMKNFLTHENVEFRCGARLNVVVGANGTGKSTILNAICLGLGGEPKLLGRADDLRAFIMHGKQKAEIEVEVAPVEEGGATHIFRRVIDGNKGSERGKGRGSSTFYINDEKVNIKTVRALVADVYNITIDNLCTFLPQDKVGNFSGYGPKQILIETEKTLSGSQHMYKTHMELIEAEEELAKGAGDVESIKAQLARLERDLGGLEREKERLEEREAALRDADLLRKKKLWLEFDALREQALGVKEEKQAIKKSLRAAQAKIAPLEEKAVRLASKKKEMETKFKTLDKKTQRCLKEMEKQRQKYETHEDNVEQVLADIRELDSKRSRLESEYNKAKERVAALDKQWNDSGITMEAADQEYKEANEKRKVSYRGYDAAKRDAVQKLRELQELEANAEQVQSKLTNLNDESARRKDRIFRLHPHLGKINRWLDGNRGTFRYQIWGPIACEVTPKTQNIAAFLEQHVPNALLKSYVVGSKEDYDKLYNTVRRKMKIPINIVVIEKDRLKPLTNRMYSDQKMTILKKEHGVLGFLDQAFTAPDAVMEALRSQAGVHKVLIGESKTQESIDKKSLLTYLSEPDAALGQKKLQSCTIVSCRGDQSFKYTQQISRYSGTASMRQDTIMPAKMLAPGVSQREKKEAEDNLAHVHEKIDAIRPSLNEAQRKKDELEAEAQEASALVFAAKKTKEELIKLKSKLKNAQRKMRDAENDLNSNDDQEKKKLAKSLMNYVSQSLSALEVHAKQQDQMMQSTIENAGVNINSRCLVVVEQQAKLAVIEKKAEYAELEQEGKRIQAAFTQIRQQLAKAKDAAQKHAPIVDSEGNDTPLKEELTNLEVDNLHELESALEEADAKVNSIVADPNVIRQYEARKAEIEATKGELEEMSNFEESKILAINSKREPWEKCLKERVQQLDVHFNKYMQEMGFVGEVKLTSAEPSEDGKSCNFKDWGIEIRVSFREGTKVRVLSQHVHSGGERSVSTIMYLMALQDMMVAPFRCVDEINQGLDERNERLVFKRIVKNSTSAPERGFTDHSGQYFLITPKLLPNLEAMDTEGVNVLFVLNGPFNFMSPTGWDINLMLNISGKRKIRNECIAQDDENSGNIVPRKAKTKKRKT